MFFTSFNTVKSQLYNKDSIQHVIAAIRKTPLDTAHLSKLRDAGYSLIEIDSALSKQLLDEALNKSLQYKDIDAITNSYRILGIWYRTFNNQDKSIENYRASLASAIRNNHLYLVAGAYFNIGNIKYGKGEYDSCIDYYLKTAAIFENPKILEDKTLVPQVLNKKRSDLYYNMSTVFNTLKNIPKANEYIDQSIALVRNNNNSIMVAHYMQQKADNYDVDGQTERALRLHLQYIPELEQSNIWKSNLQGAYQNVAKEYFKLNKLDSSKIFAQKSLHLAEVLTISDGIANANLQLGRIAMKENLYTLAENYFAKSSTYYLSSEDPEEKMSYFEEMHKLKYAEGKYREAYDIFAQFKTISDSLFNNERARQFAEREARYQSEKKDVQIQFQQSVITKKNILNSILIASAIVLLIISALVYRNYQQKQKLQKQKIAELETQQQLTATEAVLKGEEQERTRLAKDLHDGLGGMLSGIKYSFNNMKGNLVMTPENAKAFERGMDMLDTSIKEMRRVAHNMMPEALVKFGLDIALKDFCAEINQTGALEINYQSFGLENVEIDQTNAITIYRIVQELINNTMKHASATIAIVQVTKSNGQLSITVEDDGKGFDPKILQHAKGIGWSNIQSRIDFLKGKLDIDSNDGKGTSVLIELSV
jgi:signal transduction histidine kinase